MRSVLRAASPQRAIAAQHGLSDIVNQRAAQHDDAVYVARPAQLVGSMAAARARRGRGGERPADETEELRAGSHGRRFQPAQHGRRIRVTQAIEQDADAGGLGPQALRRWVHAGGTLAAGEGRAGALGPLDEYRPESDDN